MRRLTLAWPIDKPHAGAHFWANQVLQGLRANGARVQFEDIAQEPGFVVRVKLEDGGMAHTAVPLRNFI